MQIHWLLQDDCASVEAASRSNLASIRLRAAVSALRLPSGWSMSFGPNCPKGVDVLLIGKAPPFPDEHRAWLKKVVDIRSAGARVILDYTDHRLTLDTPVKPFYEAVIGFSDAAIVPSSHMKALLRGVVDLPINVIEDALEYPILPPPDKPAKNQVLWFGHAVNVRYLLKHLDEYRALYFNKKLLIVSNSAGNQLCRQYLRGFHGECFEWSIQKLKDVALTASCCIIPSDPHDPFKSGASANRLITALAFGLPVLADELPSYTEFSNSFVPIGSRDMVKVLNEPSVMTAAIVAAQQEVLPRFFPQILAEKWVQLFRSIASL